ncbi:MAG: hypothetical protein U0Q22_15275 [Acidimicrobiales bacterium]
MTWTRLALGLLAVVSGLGSFVLATTDIHYSDRNCGTAVLSTDPNKLSLDSGDLEQDEFEEQALTANCDHLVLGRRFLALGPAVICVGAVVVGQRLRDRPPQRRDNVFGTTR